MAAEVPDYEATPVPTAPTAPTDPRHAAEAIVEAYQHDILTGSAPGLTLADLIETWLAQIATERDEARTLAAEGRRAGRAEAAELLMRIRPDQAAIDLTASTPLADTGDYETGWTRDAVLGALDATGSEMTSVLEEYRDGWYEQAGYRDDAEGRLAEAQGRVSALEAALRELVALKFEVKPRNRAEYERRKPAAWEAARKLLASALRVMPSSPALAAQCIRDALDLMPER